MAVNCFKCVFDWTVAKVALSLVGETYMVYHFCLWRSQNNTEHLNAP